MRNTIIIMSCMGTIAFFMYWLMRLFFKKRCPARWQYFLLKLSLLFYLFPLPIWANDIREWLQVWKYEGEPLGTSGARVIRFDPHKKFTIMPNGDIKVSSFYQTLLALVILWIAILIILLISQFYQYKKFRENLFLYADADISSEMETVLQECKISLKIKRRVGIYTFSDTDTPFTIGFLRPCIVLPEYTYSAKELQYIFNHELMHIRHFDYGTKLLAMLAIGIHWFNPFVYLLFRELSVRGECACDEAVVKNYSREEILEYGKLILSISEQTPKIPGEGAMPVSTFVNRSKKVMKERISIMKSVKRKNLYAKIGFAVSAVFIMILSAVPVLAYENPVVDIADEYDEFNDSDFTDEDLTEEEYVTNMDPEEIIAQDELKLPDGGYSPDADEYYIDKHGELFNLFDYDGGNKRGDCHHVYEEGTYIRHWKMSVGCEKYYYKCKICRKCTNMTEKEKIQDVTYKVCCH